MPQHPAADSKSIKAAYYSMMRMYHPDQQGAGSSGSSTDGDATDSIDTNEFCALLNEIYTVSLRACITVVCVVATKRQHCKLVRACVQSVAGAPWHHPLASMVFCKCQKDSSIYNTHCCVCLFVS
jgi:hypothetical protein